MGVAPAPFGGPRTKHRHAVAWIALAVLAALAIALLVRHAPSGSSSHSSGVEGSGVASAQARRLPSFDGVELAGSNLVTVRVGDVQSVVVNADDNLLRNVTTRVDARRLVIDDHGSFTAKSPMHVDVRVPTLRSLTLSGSGVIVIDRVDARRLSVTLSGDGVVRATGFASRLDVTVGGSGDAELGLLAARDVRATVGGSGDIVVDATRTLHASIPGTGTVIYRGDPAHVTTSVTGSGAVVRG